jgi:hypothetical protein
MQIRFFSKLFLGPLKPFPLFADGGSQNDAIIRWRHSLATNQNPPNVSTPLGGLFYCCLAAANPLAIVKMAVAGKTKPRIFKGYSPNRIPFQKRTGAGRVLVGGTAHSPETTCRQTCFSCWKRKIIFLKDLAGWSVLYIGCHRFKRCYNFFINARRAGNLG